MPPDTAQETVGTQLAADMVRELGVISKMMIENQKLMMDVRDLIAEDVELRRKEVELRERQLSTDDEIAGYGEVIATTMDILSDVAAEKRTVTTRDIFAAYTSAAAEVFPDEDDDPDGGDGDVEVER